LFGQQWIASLRRSIGDDRVTGEKERLRRHQPGQSLHDQIIFVLDLIPDGTIPIHRTKRINGGLAHVLFTYLSSFFWRFAVNSQSDQPGSKQIARRDPVYWLAETRESSVDNHQNFGGNNHSRLILQCCRHALDQVKQALAARPNVCAMLDVFGRPIPLKGCRKPLGSVCILLESLPPPSSFSLWPQGEIRA
jgi:hypothetical protein